MQPGGMEACGPELTCRSAENGEQLSRKFEKVCTWDLSLAVTGTATIAMRKRFTLPTQCEEAK
jgi:hypothetical protein